METTNNQNNEMLNNLPSQTPSNLLEAQMLYNNCVHVVVNEKEKYSSLIKQNQTGNTCYMQLMQFEFNTTNLNMVYTNTRFTIYKGQMNALTDVLVRFGKKIQVEDPATKQKTDKSLELSSGNGQKYISYYVLPGRIVVLEYLESDIPEALVKAFLNFKPGTDVSKINKIKDGFKKRKTVASQPFVKLNPKTERYENIFSFKIYDISGESKDIIIKDYDEPSTGDLTSAPKILPQG